MYMMLMVIDDAEHLNEVLAAWRDAGVTGITILESTGVNRVLARHRAGAAFMGFGQVFGGSAQAGHHTLFAIIPSLALAKLAKTETEKVLGSLSNPNTGIMAVMPVAEVWGLESRFSEEEE